MKRFQEIEFETNCKKFSTALKRLEKKFPKFYEVWSERIEYMLKNGQTSDECFECGYVLHVIEDDGYFYFCFIAFNEGQVIE